MKRILILVLAAVMLISSASCAELSDLIAGGSNNYDIYNTYVDFYNYTGGSFATLVRQYFNKFGTEEEMIVRSHFDGFSLYDYNLNGIVSTTCDNAREAALKDTYGEADTKMLAFCDHFDAFTKLYVEEVNPYYSEGQYEADDFAQGRALHLRMLEGYEALLEAKSEFAKAFQPIIVEVEHADLENLRKSDYLIHYYSQLLILHGESISGMLYDLEQQDLHFLEADPHEFEALVDVFCDAQEEFKKIYQDKKRQEKEGYTGNKSGLLTSFGLTASQMRVAAKDILAMIEAGSEDIETKLTGVNATGNRKNDHPGKFDELLDRLISYYNSMV